MPQPIDRPVMQVTARQDAKPVDLDALYSDHVITYMPEISAPPVALSVIKDMRYTTIATYGNFSTLIGKAKSRKSFCALMMVAAFLRSQYDCFRASRQGGKTKVIIFDTEQSAYHVQCNVNRITRMIGASAHPEDLIVFNLRPFNPRERREIVAAVLYARDDIALAIIDGVRDLVSDINDPDQATDLSSKLLKWTAEREIHINGIIHQNKADNNARGHLGTELINKSETVFSVNLADDKHYSVIQAEQTRAEAFDDIYFEITNEDLALDYRIPKVTEYSGKSAEAKPTKITKPAQFNDMVHHQILSQAFGDTALLWGEAEVKVKAAWHQYGNSIGDSVTERFMKYYKDKGLIVKTLHNGWTYNTDIPF